MLFQMFLKLLRQGNNINNPIALRGPLSQFFSALYLKPLDPVTPKQTEQFLNPMGCGEQFGYT